MSADHDGQTAAHYAAAAGECEVPCWLGSCSTVLGRPNWTRHEGSFRSCSPEVLRLLKAGLWAHEAVIGSAKASPERFATFVFCLDFADDKRRHAVWISRPVTGTVKRRHMWPRDLATQRRALWLVDGGELLSSYSRYIQM